MFSRQKDIVHITLLSGTALNSYKKSQFDGLSNTPLVLQGAGLPDDEDDDELQLDLLQWNEDEAFETFMHKLDDASGINDAEGVRIESFKYCLLMLTVDYYLHRKVTKTRRSSSAD